MTVGSRYIQWMQGRFRPPFVAEAGAFRLGRPTQWPTSSEFAAGRECEALGPCSGRFAAAAV
jgi:hypothetical protein